MYLFSVLIIPCFLIWYVSAFTEFKQKSYIPPVVIGLVTGCIFCFIKAFFFLSSHIWTTSVSNAFWHIFTSDALAAIFIFAAWIGACIKIDRWEYKLSMFLPLVLSFYAIYIPYDIISNRFNNTAFILFIKPVMYIFMCWLIQELIYLGWKKFRAGDRVAAIIQWALSVIPLILPSFSEACWTLHQYSFIPYIIAAVMGILSIGGYILFQNRSLSEEN